MKTKLNAILSKNLRALIQGTKRATNLLNDPLNKIDVKTLAIGDGLGGDGDAFVAIDEQLGSQIMELARTRFVVLGLVTSKDVSSAAYREFLFQNAPTTFVTEGDEQTDPDTPLDIWPLTGTPTYTDVTMKVGKLYAKPLISDEAINDPTLNIFDHLIGLLIEEFGRKWNSELLVGDGDVNNIRGILGDTRLVPTTSLIVDPVTRGKDVFPVLTSGVIDSLGDSDPTAINSAYNNLVNMEFFIPSVYQENSAYIMNKNTLKTYRLMVDQSGERFVRFVDGNFTINDRAVYLDDFMPNVDGSGPTTNHKFPVIFGDLSRAYAICNVEDKFILDPYSADGAVLVKHTSRKGDLMQRNDAIVILRSHSIFS